MKNEYTSFWAELFIWLVTFIVFGFYTALTFFSLTGDWNFLTSFSYWFDLTSSTTIAWLLRFLWVNKGLTNALFKDLEIKDKEQGKSTVITEITSNNLTDALELEIKRVNQIEKRRQYKIKCERKIRKLRNRKRFKRKLPYWQNELKNAIDEDFDISIVKVKYYQYDIDSMLSSTYRPNHETETRGNITGEILKSFRISILTMIGFAVLGAIQLWLKDYNNEDLVILLGKFLIFIVNMYSGYDLGGKFIKTKYSNDITKDYVLMKRVLKNNLVAKPIKTL